MHRFVATSEGKGLAGVPECRKAGAEALTVMAASSAVPLPSLGVGGRHGANAGTVNLKVEVMRAGAIPALASMLRAPEEGCVRAAANALYVIAQEEEGRGAMQDSGVREALQAVIALAKQRPPRVAAQTRKDCEHTMTRMMA
jgi:Armadillo/beta-catenin-like repeat